MSIFRHKSSGNLVFNVIFDAYFLLLNNFILKLELIYQLIQCWYFDLEVSSFVRFFICQIIVCVWFLQDLRYSRSPVVADIPKFDIIPLIYLNKSQIHWHGLCDSYAEVTW